MNSQSDGATVTFSGFSSAIATSGTYYFITADLSSSASGTIALTIGSQANLTITGGAIASGFANAALSSGALTITPAKEISIKGNNITIVNGDVSPSLGDHTDFGSIDVVLANLARTFTIENLGISTLTLTNSGSNYIAITGHTDDFYLTGIPSSSIAGGGSTTFQITFNPTATGLRSATVTIANDDSDENPYTFAIQGTGTVAPEIEIVGNGLIPNGDNTPSVDDLTDFGTASVATGTVEHSFGIVNIGSATLNLTGSSPFVSIGGANSEDFSVTTPPGNAIPSGGSSVTFVITFNPSAVGLRSATVSVANDDADENPYTFAIQGTGIAPEINLKQDVTSIADGGNYDFSNHLLSSNTDVVFTIENTGTDDLGITTPISIGGANADQFSIQAQPASSVAAAGTTTFTVRFAPTAVGAQTATISIANNDGNENPYNLTITGTGIAPEMDLKQGVTPIADGGSYDFSNHLLSSNTDVVFTIENTGAANLTLTTPISIGGADADQFSIQAQPASPVAASGTTTFTVRFTPNSIGVKTATISIANNDDDENPYGLTITGTGIAPEMDLKQGVTPIADGGSFDFSGQLLSTNTDVVFTIENTGAANLTLTTPISIGGANADQFSIQAQPTSPVAASGTTTFTVRFTPTSTGAKTATISIANNDDNENPYDLTITGTGVSPEIAVSGNGNEILNGDNSPSSMDFTDFGSADITSGSVVRIFTISNSGTGQLNLTGGSPYVAIGGINKDDFSVTGISPSNSIAAGGGSTSFEITFDPSAIGIRSATISIANNDTDENPYSFSIRGAGTNLPTTQSSNFSQTSATASALNVSWTRGDGSNCAVFVQEGTTSGTLTPSDNTTYSPSTDWNAKTSEIGTGWYCVYVGNDANPSVNLTNLTQGEWYRIAAFEYNSTPGNEKYLASSAANNPISFHTLTNTANVSAGFDATHTGAENNKYWDVRYFNSVESAVSGSATGATITIRSSNGSTSTTATDIDADVNPFIIENGDLVVSGTITAATNHIQAIGTGYLVQAPGLNIAKTYPIGDGTNNYTATVTCLNNPTQPFKMKINNNKVVAGSSLMDFWDISGETGLNATIMLRIPKSALKSGSWSANNQIRIFNGTRYVPIHAARVSTTVFSDHVEITVTGVNDF